MTIAKSGPVTAKQKKVRNAFIDGKLTYATAVRRFEREAGHAPQRNLCDVLMKERRSEIIEIITDNPGIHVSDIYAMFSDGKKVVEADVTSLRRSGKIHTSERGVYHPGPRMAAE